MAFGFHSTSMIDFKHAAIEVGKALMLGAVVGGVAANVMDGTELIRPNLLTGMGAAALSAGAGVVFKILLSPRPN
jgi:hypothetical protein